MTFKIEPFGGARYRGHYADHCDIRQYVGLKPHGKMPTDFTYSGRVPLTDGRMTALWVTEGHKSENGWRGKSSAHRCFVHCPDCLATVPAGRTHQHKCKA